MDSHLKEALAIVKAQAGVRNMAEEEICSMLQKLSQNIRSISEESPGEETPAGAQVDPAKAIKETQIICVECGHPFKLLSKKHLASHGLTPEQYRKRHGYKKGMALVCKALQRTRRKKMKDMKLWERREQASSSS